MNKHKSAGNRSIFLTFVAAHLSKMCQFNNVVVYIYFHLQWRQRNSHFPIWCQKLHQRGRLFEVSIQLRRRWICVCVLKECLNLEKIGLSLISSFIRTSSKAFSTSFSKNSLMIMEPSLSTFGSSLSPPLTMRCAIPMSFCTLQEWGKVFGHHQNFEMNDFLLNQLSLISTSAEWGEGVHLRYKIKQTL